MIAMVLLACIGLYLVLFVVVGFKAKKWSFRLTGWAILLAPPIWMAIDFSVGYYHFQKLCKAEAGFKVNEPSPAPAKIIRLDSYSYNAGHAEEILHKRPSVVTVEAKDKKYDYLSKPVAFAWYVRGSDGQVVSRLVDKVGKPSGKGEIQVMESAVSNADYIFTETLDYPGDRMSRQIQQLRSKDGKVIGSSISLDYDSAQSLLASPLHTSRCGQPRATADKEYNKLLDLIAPLNK